jgi:LDH2 family malate/lactate/ureidoglycolate dehydrogenase
MGMYIVSQATDMAIDKAQTHGIGVVAASNYSSATGALGMWARKITNAGLVGIVMSQCSEMVAPHGAYEAIFGTNPIAIGVPTAGRAQVCGFIIFTC